MERHQARYPFFESARAAVEAADVDLAEVITSSQAVLDRATERVTRGLSEGTIGDQRRSNRVELLSYPVARVLVSLLEDPRVIDAYASAEAKTARHRLSADLTTADSLQSVDRGGMTVERVLAEFDLTDAVDRVGDGFRLAVPAYLRLASDREGQQWRLVERDVAGGVVSVTETELLALLETALQHRVAEGLPLAVPEEIADGLAAERARLEEMLTDYDFATSYDRVDPAAFPPCISTLRERAQAGETLSPPAQFTLVSFLAALGLDAGQIVEFTDGGLDRESVAYQLAHIRGDRGIVYAPPGCAVIEAYGFCAENDPGCAEAEHPLAYYEQALQ